MWGRASCGSFILLSGDSVANVAVLAADLRSRGCVTKAFNDDSNVGTEAGANDSDSPAHVTSLDRLRDHVAIRHDRQNKTTTSFWQHYPDSFQKLPDRPSP